jgi:hypothetical protein
MKPGSAPGPRRSRFRRRAPLPDATGAPIRHPQDTESTSGDHATSVGNIGSLQSAAGGAARARSKVSDKKPARFDVDAIAEAFARAVNAGEASIKADPTGSVAQSQERRRKGLDAGEREKLRQERKVRIVQHWLYPHSIGITHKSMTCSLPECVMPN